MSTSDDGTPYLSDNDPPLKRIEEGEKLLAPNGKPSNLTPFQHAQVRTENFKKYFGDWEAVARKKALFAMPVTPINTGLLGNIIQLNLWMQMLCSVNFAPAFLSHIYRLA